ncbi:CBASS oligonucleotide cyclase [Bradyrhizobium canariense]|uniref:CBASS oligonucleotide cyclase n=1 Tax=Bradyrhizobium canariense TaxID=255045 RepID=UPI001B8A6780|nr:CBASS oligonucleotide cyclase [Bradyrhizobium canariense]MBR0955233.1 nucleotidyltransferase [Bradyrhizobium canariense]
MGGSGGGNVFQHRSPEQLAKQVRKAEDETTVKVFETDLNSLLGELLASANSRNVDLVQDRLSEIKDELSDTLEESVDLLFGGSVAKHTYVDGISDIDSLLVFSQLDFEGDKPSAALERISEIIRNAVPTSATVAAGRLAVTIEYKDAMQIQLLPAFRTNGGLRVPSFLRDGWSHIAPQEFQKALTARNDECGGKLVPTIKLAKAVIGTLPEKQRLTGYHVESLAIAAFRDYQGAKTSAAMLPVFFERARELVLQPIRDSTGQSIHVDGYLGETNSASRVASSHVLGRIAKRMRNASAHMSHDQWKALFGLADE